MATISTSPSWERLLLSNGDRQDLKKTTRTIWWENRKCVALCVLIYTCSFFTGYEMFVSSSLINYRSFIERFGIEFHGRKEISVSLQQGMRLWFNLGAFLSNCLQWYVAENYLGRVRLAQCGLVCAIFSTILQIVAPDRTCFMFGRFFMGISDAVIRYGIFLWVTESAIAPIRATSSAFFGVKSSIGGLIALLLGRTFSTWVSARGYQLPLIIGLGPQTVSVLLLFVLPESPRWLLMRGRTEDARASLRRLRSGQHGTDESIDSELQSMAAALKLEQEAAHSVQDTFKGTEGSLVVRFKKSHFYAAFVGTNRLRMLASMAGGVFYVASGFDFALSGATYLLRILGEPDPFKYAIIASAIALAGSLAHFLYFAEAVGHRPLILSGFTISACGLFAIGLTFVLPDVDVITRRRVLIAFVGMTTFSNCGCIITLAHVIANELPAQEFRSVSVSMHWLTFFLSTFVHDLIQPYWINVTELNLAGKIAWLYVGTCLFMLVFCYFCIPESQGVSLEEMDLLYNSRISPRKSKQWVKEHRKTILQSSVNSETIISAQDIEKRGSPPLQSGSGGMNEANRLVGQGEKEEKGRDGVTAKVPSLPK